MYEYSTLPNSFEEQMVSWDHYYAEQYLGTFGGSLGNTEMDRMVISMSESIEVMAIEDAIASVQMPDDVYNVYLGHHFEGRDLPCQQSI